MIMAIIKNGTDNIRLASEYISIVENWKTKVAKEYIISLPAEKHIIQKYSLAKAPIENIKKTQGKAYLEVVYSIDNKLITEKD